MEIPQRTKNETIDEWICRYNEYHNEIQKERDRSTALYLDEVAKINREHQVAMEKLYKDSLETQRIRSDVEALIVQIKARKREREALNRETQEWFTHKGYVIPGWLKEALREFSLS